MSENFKSISSPNTYITRIDTHARLGRFENFSLIISPDKDHDEYCANSKECLYAADYVENLGVRLGDIEEET